MRSEKFEEGKAARRNSDRNRVDFSTLSSDFPRVGAAREGRGNKRCSITWFSGEGDPVY